MQVFEGLRDYVVYVSRYEGLALHMRNPRLIMRLGFRKDHFEDSRGIIKDVFTLTLY